MACLLRLCMYMQEVKTPFTACMSSCLNSIYTNQLASSQASQLFRTCTCSCRKSWESWERGYHPHAEYMRQVQVQTTSVSPIPKQGGPLVLKKKGVVSQAIQIKKSDIHKSTLFEMTAMGNTASDLHVHVPSPLAMSFPVPVSGHGLN